MNLIRQGDVLLLQVSRLPNGAQVRQPQGDVILAYGEATGHAHRIKDLAAVRMWDAGAERYLQVLATASLSHEEHATALLPPGIYRLPQQVEYTPQELRNVAD